MNMAEGGANLIPLDILSQNFRDLQYELQTQGLSNQIKQFSVEGNSRNFRTWIRDMQKVGVTLNNDDERMKILTIMTLKGPAEEFVSRQLRQNPQMMWANLLTAMKNRFADLSDAQFPRLKFKRVKQNAGESIQNFSERIVDLAEEAFVTADLTDPLIQQQLKDVFIDRIQNDHIACKLIGEQPVTLDRAVQIATNEQITNRTFDLRRGEELMEVDRGQCQPEPDIHDQVAELRQMFFEVLEVRKFEER